MWKILKYGFAIIFLLALFTRVMSDPEITGKNSSPNVSQQLQQAQDKKSQESPKNYAAKANRDYKGNMLKS